MMTQAFASSTPPIQEVAPEFRQRCEQVYAAWRRAEIALNHALDQMRALDDEAALQHQYAHQGVVHNYIGMMYGYRAELDNSIRHFLRARDLSERANNPGQVVRMTMNLGESYRLKGDFPRARQYFSTAYTSATQLGIINTQAYAASNEGHLLISMNQLDAAHARLELALQHANDIEDERNRLEISADAYQGLTNYWLRVGDTQQAWTHAVESLRLAHQLGDNFLLGFAYRTMADVLTALGHTPAAPVDHPEPMEQDAAATQERLGDPDVYFQLAVEAFMAIKAEGEIARTIFAQAKSLVARGQKITASRKFHQAMLMFTKLGMKDDAQKAVQAQMDAQAR